MTTDYERLEDIRRISNPLRTALTIVITVMLVEAGLMVLLQRLHGLSPWLEMVIDSVALACVVSPVLYVTVFRSLRTLLAEYHQSLSELDNAKLKLEREVRRQTDELRKANLLLQIEARHPRTRSSLEQE